MRKKITAFIYVDKINIIVSVLAFLLSFGWIIGASYYGKGSTDAGRGGSIAIALSFFLLFIGGGLGLDVYALIVKSGDSADAKVQAIIRRLDLDAATTKHQNYYLAFSSILGTICWGFGDWFSHYVPSFLLTGFGALVSVIGFK